MIFLRYFEISVDFLRYLGSIKTVKIAKIAPSAYCIPFFGTFLNFAHSPCHCLTRLYCIVLYHTLSVVHGLGKGSKTSITKNTVNGKVKNKY